MRQNLISFPVVFFSVYWSHLPSFLLWERTLFSHRLQVRISVLLNQINLMALLQNDSAHYYPNALQHQSLAKWIQVYHGYDLLMDFHYLCILPLLLFPLISTPLHLSDVTQALVVQPVNSPRRPSQLSCPKASPVHASPPTIASPHFVEPRSASDVECWPAAKPWSSIETAEDTWSLLH